MEIASGLTFEKKWLDLKRNCDYYFSRIIGYPLGPPEHAYFSSTVRCNLRCKMCNIPGPINRIRDELNTAEVKKILDQVAGLKINHFIFSGGEPLLRKDIFDLVKYARDKKIAMVDIITNGTLIDEGIAEKLAQSGVTHITVSIDGLEEQDDFIRGKGSFSKAITALDVVNKYRDNGLPSLGINFTVMDCNISQILPMINLARINRCNTFVLQPLLSDNTNMDKREKNKLWVSQENMPRLKEAIREVIKLKKTMRDLTIHVNEKILELIPDYFLDFPQGSNIQCYECIVRISISHNGDLWSCQGIYGNTKTELLRNHWVSFKAKKIRQKIKECQSHCLQSCVHLAELTDIYSEARKFKVLINKGKNNKIYLKKLSALFENYKFLLEKRLSKYSKNASLNNNLEELGAEIKRISVLIDND